MLMTVTARDCVICTFLYLLYISVTFVLVFIFFLSTMDCGRKAYGSVGLGSCVKGYPIAWVESVAFLICGGISHVVFELSLWIWLGCIFRFEKRFECVLTYGSVCSYWSDPVWLTGSFSPAMHSLLQSIFFFALTWSCGGSTDDKGRIKFDKLLRELITVSRFYLSCLRVFATLLLSIPCATSLPFPWKAFLWNKVLMYTFVCNDLMCTLHVSHLSDFASVSL